MYKLLAVLTFALLISACNSNDFDNEPKPEPLPPIVDPDPTPDPTPEPVPDPEPVKRVFTINWEEVDGVEYDSHGADGIYMSFKHLQYYDETDYTLYAGTISGDFYYKYYWYGQIGGTIGYDERVICNKESCSMNTMHPDIAPVNIILTDEYKPVEITYTYTTYNATNHEWISSSELTIQFNPMDYAEGIRYISIDPVTQEITIDEDQETANNHFENP